MSSPAGYDSAAAGGGVRRTGSKIPRRGVGSCLRRVPFTAYARLACRPSFATGRASSLRERCTRVSVTQGVVAANGLWTSPFLGRRPFPVTEKPWYLALLEGPPIQSLIRTAATVFSRR